MKNSEAVHLEHDPHHLILEPELQYNKVLRHVREPQKREVILEVLHLFGTRYLSLILDS